jgi:hypothetical protein
MKIHKEIMVGKNFPKNNGKPNKNKGLKLGKKED